MTSSIVTVNSISCYIAHDDDIIISDAQSALDFIMTVLYETNCNRIAINKEAIAESFFILSTGMAGEILQKFSNYHVKFAIIGDFSRYTSKPLIDFMYECNKGNSIYFVSSEQQAIERLTSEQGL